MGSGPWLGCTVRRAMETSPNQGMPIGGTALEKSLWESEGFIKVGHVVVHQKNPFPDLESDRIQQANIAVCLLLVAMQ